MGTRRFLVAATWVAALSLFASWLAWRGSPRQPPRPQSSSNLARSLNNPQSDGTPWRWSVVHARASQGALVIEADIISMAESMAAARAIVEPVQQRYTEILVYFRQAGAAGTRASRRVQWTPTGGYAELVLR